MEITLNNRSDESARRMLALFAPDTQYITLDTAIVLDDGFEFVFDFYCGSLREQVLFGNYTDVDNYWRFGVTATGAFEFIQCIAGAVETLTTPEFLDIQYMRRVVFSRDMDWVRIETNVIRAESVMTHNELTLNQIGGFNSSLYPTCALSNLVISDSDGEQLNCTLDDSFTTGGANTIVNTANSIVVTGVNLNTWSGVEFTTQETSGSNIILSNANWDYASHLATDYFDMTGEDWGVTRTFTDGLANGKSDGVFQQRVSFDNTSTKEMWWYVGANLTKLDLPNERDGEVTIHDSDNSKQITLINRSGVQDGGLFNLSVSPILEIEDPREQYTVVFVGDSITERLFNYEGDRLWDVQTERDNINMNAIKGGHGGFTAKQLDNVLQTYIDQVAGMKRVLFVFMMGTNRQTKPDTTSYTDIRGDYNYLKNMINRVKAEGHEAAVMQKTASSSNETEGVTDHILNKEVFNVICKELTPHWYDFANDYPLLKTYDWTLGKHAEGWFADNVHPNDVGARGLSEEIIPVLEERLPLLFDENNETSSLTITVSGKVNEVEKIHLWTRDGLVTKPVFVGDITFSSGSFTVELNVPVGTVIYGEYEGDNPPTTGSGLYGVTV